MILYYYPQWLCISTWRFFKLFTESLLLFPCCFSSIPRLVLVSLLSVFALLISYLHLSIVFIEHLIFSIFYPVKPYPTVFIVGPPRSGTTLMHKLLATDTKTFSSMKMWELFFAPAVSQKILLICVGKIDNLFGAPFFRLITFTERKLFHKFNRIHKLGLFNVEEDALILFHLFSTYHLSFLIGNEHSYTHLNYDKGIPDAVWAYYKICVDNHMRLNPRKTYLSKNPFFSGCSESLNDLFNEAKFLYMDRDINQVAPSFFSLKKFLSHVFYGNQPSKIKYKLILKTLLFWRDSKLKDICGSMSLRVRFKELTTEPINLVIKIYQFLGVKIGAEYKNNLMREAHNAKRYKSEHRYSSKNFDLNSL